MLYWIPHYDKSEARVWTTEAADDRLLSASSRAMEVHHFVGPSLIRLAHAWLPRDNSLDPWSLQILQFNLLFPLWPSHPTRHVHGSGTRNCLSREFVTIPQTASGESAFQDRCLVGNHRPNLKPGATPTNLRWAGLTQQPGGGYCDDSANFLGPAGLDSCSRYILDHGGYYGSLFISQCGIRLGI